MGREKSSTSVLLLHGLGSLSSKWENEWKSELSKGARVIVPDYPVPFPRDLRQVARSIVDGLDSTPLSIVGHSLGGMVAIEVVKMALAMGKVVKCVVLVATTGKGHQHPLLTEMITILDGHGTDPLRTTQRLLALSHLHPEFSSLAHSQSVRSFMEQDARSLESGLQQARAALVWMNSPAAHTSQVVAGVAAPRIVVVAAGLDDILPPSQNVGRISDTLRPLEITDIVMLEDESHDAGQIFTGADAAEFVLGCGSMSTVSRIRLAARSVASRTPTQSIAVAAILVVVLIVALRLAGGSRPSQR